MIPLSPEWWPYLTMKTKDPVSKCWYFFIAKCLPFSVSISCAIFQRLSNALAYITDYRLSKVVPHRGISNYLDDFLKIALSQSNCNLMLKIFHQICEELCVLFSKEKTVWASLFMVFLGILLDGHNHVLALPTEKIEKANVWFQVALENKKIKVKDMQKMTGLLNFMNKAIVPGRNFTRRMYNKMSGKTGCLKLHHHIYLDKEFRADCLIWLKLLQNAEQ